MADVLVVYPDGHEFPVPKEGSEFFSELFPDCYFIILKWLEVSVESFGSIPLTLVWAYHADQETKAKFAYLYPSALQMDLPMV